MLLNIYDSTGERLLQQKNPGKKFPGFMESHCDF